MSRLLRGFLLDVRDCWNGFGRFSHPSPQEPVRSAFRVDEKTRGRQPQHRAA
jgi:hypothetical protein